MSSFSNARIPPAALTGSMVTTYEEITERKQHLQELQRREEELQIQNERF